MAPLFRQNHDTQNQSMDFVRTECSSYTNSNLGGHDVNTDLKINKINAVLRGLKRNFLCFLINNPSSPVGGIMKGQQEEPSTTKIDSTKQPAWFLISGCPFVKTGCWFLKVSKETNTLL